MLFLLQTDLSSNYYHSWFAKYCAVCVARLFRNSTVCLLWYLLEFSITIAQLRYFWVDNKNISR